MKKIDELLGELIQAAYNSKKHDVFVKYSPHVEYVLVQIYFNGWKDRKEDEGYTVYLRHKDANLKLKAVIDYIKYLGGINK